MVRTTVFSLYNILKGDIPSTPTIELSRLNKALSIVQTNGYERKYFTTISGCTCPDATMRGTFVCKHRLAYMLTHPDDTLFLRFNGEGPWDRINIDRAERKV